MMQAQLVQDGGVKVFDAHAIFNGGKPKFVGAAVAHSASSRRRGVPMIVPTLLSCGNASLDQVETPSQVEYHSALLGKTTAVGMGAL